VRASTAGLCGFYADGIARGDLVHILPAWSPPRGAVHALMLPGRFRPAKTDVALEMLRQRVPGACGHHPRPATNVAPDQARAKGSVRTRRPVAANSALATAGAIGGTPGSPAAVGCLLEGMICTSTLGISSILST